MHNCYQRLDCKGSADFELCQHEAFLVCQHLAPMDPCACSQFRAISYPQISVSISLTVAKASVMSLLGIIQKGSYSLFISLVYVNRSQRGISKQKPDSILIMPKIY